MLRGLAILTIALTGVDHWTTYLCLSAPVDGWLINEANPVAQHLFEIAGLGPGLAIDTLITVAAITFLITTHIFDRTIKIGLLGVITVSTGYAVVNNLDGITRMGIAPWSGVA